MGKMVEFRVIASSRLKKELDDICKKYKAIGISNSSNLEYTIIVKTKNLYKILLALEESNISYKEFNHLRTVK